MISGWLYGLSAGNTSHSWGSGLSLPNTFNYEYDKLGRLSKAASTGIVMSEEMNYDEMGNISGLNRDNSEMKPYSYDGNKLLYVNGLTGPYSYDNNGNVVKDGRNGMNLTYNSLNLPVSATDGTNYLNYIYDATGNRVAKYTNGSVRSYVHGIEAIEGIIDIIHTEEGVARNNGSGDYSYEYNLSDHLGNVRTTFYQNPASQQTEVIQRDDYYAFGLRKMNSPNSNTNKYLYNGKELQEALGQYDYGARFYDPVIGRFNTIDPMAEISRRWSPYGYAESNPVRNIDVDGMWTETANGYTSDNAEEAQAYFKQLQGSQQQDGPGDKNKDKKKPQKQNGFFSALTKHYTGPLEATMTPEQRAQYFKESAEADAWIMGGEAIGALLKVGRVGSWIRGLFSSSAEALSQASVEEKVLRYLLNAEHTGGGATKAKWFREALGFTTENSGDLAKQIVFDGSKAVQTSVTEFGTKFNQVIKITGANGRAINVTTAWIRNNDGVVRLVTAIPTKL